MDWEEMVNLHESFLKGEAPAERFSVGGFRAGPSAQAPRLVQRRPEGFCSVANREDAEGICRKLVTKGHFKEAFVVDNTTGQKIYKTG